METKLGSLTSTSNILTDTTDEILENSKDPISSGAIFQMKKEITDMIGNIDTKLDNIIGD